MNAPTSAEFVWELPTEKSDSQLSSVREEARRALEREHAPLRLGCLLLAGIIYALPLALVQDQMLEAYAGLSETRAKIGIFLLLGISTLVVLPLFGYLAYLSAESSALVKAARPYTGTVVPSSKRGHAQVRFSTPFGTHDLTVRTNRPPDVGSSLMIYAAIEEANLAAVELPENRERQMRIGQICR
jgi:hypothetical protein